MRGIRTEIKLNANRMLEGRGLIEDSFEIGETVFV